MKIAFHNRGGFTPRWIEYCKKNGIDFKMVNAYDSDIVDQLKDCDAFMWHHHQANYKDVLFAKQLLFSLEKAGKVVFPNTASGTLFDDKVGEKYLLEAIGAPVVPSYVFYTKHDALAWIENTRRCWFCQCYAGTYGGRGQETCAEGIRQGIPAI